MLTMVVSCTLVVIHSISAPSGDCPAADQAISLRTNVAMP